MTAILSEKIDLPSGAKLEITPSEFRVAKAAYMVVFEEVKSLDVQMSTELDWNFFKNLFCLAISSPKIEAALWTCMKRVTYNGLKVTEDTFEPIEARQDYIPVLFEVARVNIYPFMKSLFARYKDSFSQLIGLLHA